MARGRSTKSLRATTGKRYWREADARSVLRAWVSSGAELSRFATEHGVSASRLSRWARRLGARRGRERGDIGRASVAALKLRFHPVELIGGETARRSDAMEVVLVDGRRVRLPAGFASEDLERVLEVLEGRARC